MIRLSVQEKVLKLKVVIMLERVALVNLRSSGGDDQEQQQCRVVRASVLGGGGGGSGGSESCVAVREDYADEEDFVKAGGSDIMFVQMQQNKDMDEKSKLVDETTTLLQD
ncbi:hypothetical protein Bca4012_031253 [Brassica carinata]|uniref:Uncharacterized protein n=1 Tax=Brassica carinata TaxID=52824 RepID=A0A8X7RHF2_BRACI|nr:hypothetical protein Bca52824_047511 [Brassica carinata]